MKIIIIAGQPGSGKGTQAGLLADKFGYVHVSTGAMLRKEISLGTELGNLAKARIDNGNFVPDYVACQMITSFLEGNKNLKGVILDGFPRTLSQCIDLEPILAEYRAKVNLFIDIVVGKEELIKRLSYRNILQSRPDDSDMTIIEHRFELYNNLTKPIIDFYKQKGVYYSTNGNSNALEVFTLIEDLVINSLKK